MEQFWHLVSMQGAIHMPFWGLKVLFPMQASDAQKLFEVHLVQLATVQLTHIAAVFPLAAMKVKLSKQLEHTLGAEQFAQLLLLQLIHAPLLRE